MPVQPATLVECRNANKISMKYLISLIKNHGTCLKDESLYNLMAEVEAIVNSRSLTMEAISNPQSLTPLSLN